MPAEYATKSAVKPSEYGSITGRVAKTLIVELNVERPLEMDQDVTEVQIYVNGRKYSTMNPHRARQLGIAAFADKW